MMSRLAGFMVYSFVLIGICASAAADTGTYVIADHRVKLTPHADGPVQIEYYQKWRVTGGNIPWITVGVPNRNFEIIEQKTSGAARQVAANSSGDWAGVRIDLDRSYQPGQTFEVGFAIVQHQLFQAEGDRYKVEFTPGWYDRAKTDRLKLEVFFFAKIETVKATPPPSVVEGQSMVWEKTNLREGERFTISVSIAKQAFPGQIKGSELKTPVWAPLAVLFAIAGFFLVHPAFLFVAFIVIMMLLSALMGKRRGYGRGGSIFFPGGIGGGGGGGGGGGRHTGGGGGFGGRSASCACACVSCACACACAGGGGAGCDRKLRRVCPLCRACENTDCIMHKEHAGPA